MGGGWGRKEGGDRSGVETEEKIASLDRLLGSWGFSLLSGLKGRVEFRSEPG